MHADAAIGLATSLVRVNMLRNLLAVLQVGLPCWDSHATPRPRADSGCPECKPSFVEGSRGRRQGVTSSKGTLINSWVG